MGHRLWFATRPNAAAGVSFAAAMALGVLLFHFRVASHTSIPVPALACTYAVAMASAGALGYVLGRWYGTAPGIWSAETVLLPIVILALAAILSAGAFMAYLAITGEEPPRNTAPGNLGAIAVAAAWVFALTSWPAIVPAFLAASVLSYRAHHPRA